MTLYSRISEKDLFISLFFRRHLQGPELKPGVPEMLHAPPASGPGLLSPWKALSKGKAPSAPAASRSRRPCWAGWTSSDSRKEPSAQATGSKLGLKPRNPNAHRFSPPAPTKASLSGLGVSRRACFPPWAGRGGKGGVWNGICEFSALQVAQSHRPRGRMGSARPGLGTGHPAGVGPCPPGLMSCSLNPRLDGQAVRACLLPVQEGPHEQRGSCSDTPSSQWGYPPETCLNKSISQPILKSICTSALAPPWHLIPQPCKPPLSCGLAHTPREVSSGTRGRIRRLTSMGPGDHSMPFSLRSPLTKKHKRGESAVADHVWPGGWPPTSSLLQTYCSPSWVMGTTPWTLSLQWGLSLTPPLATVLLILLSEPLRSLRCPHTVYSTSKISGHPHFPERETESPEVLGEARQLQLWDPQFGRYSPPGKEDTRTWGTPHLDLQGRESYPRGQL